MKDWETLHGRMEWVLAARGWSRREWSRSAGMSQDTVARALTRLASGGDGPKNPSLRKLATAARVPFEWFATGVGSPDGAAPPEAEVPADGAPPMGRLDVMLLRSAVLACEGILPTLEGKDLSDVRVARAKLGAVLDRAIDALRVD